VAYLGCQRAFDVCRDCLCVVFNNCLRAIATPINSRKHLAIGVAVFVVGLVVAAVQIMPSAESAFFTPINEMPWNEKFTKGFVALFKGWLTVPDFRSLHFWNSNLFVGLSKPFSAAVGLLLYLVPLLLFFKKRKVLFFVYSALLGMQIFFFLTQRSATRHDGMAFLILIVALWMQLISHR
jgi:hypothetical protein